MHNIAMKEVKSTNLSHVGYDEATSTLAVRFRTGGEYLYKDVSHKAFTDMMGSVSIGKFFSKYIKPLHKFEKVAP